MSDADDVINVGLCGFCANEPPHSLFPAEQNYPDAFLFQQTIDVFSAVFESSFCNSVEVSFDGKRAD